MATHADIAIDFRALRWSSVTGEGRDGRSKTWEKRGQRIRLLEFYPGWNEENWCEREHTGFVLTGSFFLELEGQSRKLRIAKGSAFSIPARVKHKASCRSKCKVFITD